VIIEIPWNYLSSSIPMQMIQYFGCYEKWVYIEKGGKCKILAKNNIVNRFIKCLSQLRQLKDKPDELWRLIRIRQYLNWFRTPITKVKMIQTYLNRFNTSQRVFMIRLKIFWLDSDVIRFKNSLNDSPQVKDFW